MAKSANARLFTSKSGKPAWLQACHKVTRCLVCSAGTVHQDIAEAVKACIIVLAIFLRRRVERKEYDVASQCQSRRACSSCGVHGRCFTGMGLDGHGSGAGPLGRQMPSRARNSKMCMLYHQSAVKNSSGSSRSRLSRRNNGQRDAGQKNTAYRTKVFSRRESFATATFEKLGASVAAPPWFRQMVSLGKQLSGATGSICEIINQQAKAAGEGHLARRLF